MGVPAFFGWLVNKYPKVVEDADHVIQNPNLEFDNLYLDMNPIIHTCFHPEDQTVLNIPLPKTFEDVFRNVFEYIDRVVEVVRPRKLLYMAIDGVASRAKMNQQRAGRFQSAVYNQICEAEEERLRQQFKMEGKQVLCKQESGVSGSIVVTPGTEFMLELSKALKKYISSRLTCEWKDIMVILSDVNVPGEGEHKIMSYIRKQRSLHGYNPNTSHCAYGWDADLIMLAMATHEPHFSILRQDYPIQQPPKITANPFKFLHIWLLREYLELDMKIEDPPKNFSFDIERIIDDFIFMCFFVGNDFLRGIPSLETHEGAIDLLMTVYKKEFNKLGGYLVDTNRIGEKNDAFVNLSRVEKFILIVGTYEEKIFKKTSKITARKLRWLVSDSKNAKQEERNAACHLDLVNESTSDCALQIKNATASSTEILQNTEELEDELEKCITEKFDLFMRGEFPIDDEIKLGTAGYKERYYKYKFSVDGHTDMECKRKEVVQKYTEGLLWVLKCYFSEVASWAWFYPFRYGPFASDFKGMGQVRVNFEKSEPLLPLDQLLCVVPRACAYALPKAYAQLMLDEHSRIIDLFPQDGNRFLWQDICKLWIEESRLLAETKRLEDELSENERMRNSVKVDSLFVRSSSKFAEKICSLCLEKNPSYKFDTRISDSIGGIISLCHEYVEKPCLGKEICDQKKDHVLCLYYELPADSNHVPRLLSGVNLPEKTIFEADVMETELWHEHQRWKSGRFKRVYSQDKWRSENTESSASKFSSNETAKHRRIFSSNTAPEVIHKGAGVGWGSGRGKASNSSNIKSIDAMPNNRMPYLSPFHNQLEEAGYSHFTTNDRDTRSQHFVDNFRQFRISDSNHLQRPSDSSNFQPYNDGYMNQSRNVPYHGSPSDAMPFGRGQGRIQHGSHSVNTWNNVSSSTNISWRPRWNGAKAHQVKDQNRW